MKQLWVGARGFHGVPSSNPGRLEGSQGKWKGEGHPHSAPALGMDVQGAAQGWPEEGWAERGGPAQPGVGDRRIHLRIHPVP